MLKIFNTGKQEVEDSLNSEGYKGSFISFLYNRIYGRENFEEVYVIVETYIDLEMEIKNLLMEKGFLVILS